MRYPIGTVFTTRGKHPRTCTVIDHWTTTNAKDEVVRQRYVATHMLAGREVTDFDVAETTIRMGIVFEPTA